MAYATRTPTPEALLERMKPGVLYAPYTLSRMLGLRSYAIRSLLLDMEKAGVLSSTRRGRSQSLYFVIAGTEALEQPESRLHIDPATVAQPRTYAVMTGEIRGYDAEIARRQQLCMSIRRVA
ncbi:hypothetical protein FSO04_24370 [Paraburkholderia madseniana]|uniref:Uncharacterized protein n=1 Tax=Paraburkholderia madseniana TaxID=2599607 RepID=A0A6N6WBR8_9BURK|nr:hypothetical protein [Paraburkholderia madseniana]KAE8757358.1 hypothetical protein FSO04_24370 [Paraburkholderia madseniana]